MEGKMKVKELKTYNKFINLIKKDSKTQYYKYFTVNGITYKVKQLKKTNYSFEELLEL